MFANLSRLAAAILAAGGLAGPAAASGTDTQGADEGFHCTAGAGLDGADGGSARRFSRQEFGAAGLAALKFLGRRPAIAARVQVPA